MVSGVYVDVIEQGDGDSDGDGCGRDGGRVGGRSRR